MVLAMVGSATVGAGASPIDDKRAEAAALASKLYEQAGRIVEIDTGYRRAQVRLAGAEADEARAEAELAAVIRRLDGARSALEAHAIGAYVQGGDITFLSSVVRVGGFEPVVRRQYIKTVTGLDRKVIGELRAMREDVDLRTARLRDARKKVNALVESIGDDRDARNRALAQQNALLARVNGDLAGLVAAEQARLDAEAAAEAEARARAAAARRPGTAATPSAVAAEPVPEGPVQDTWDCIKQLESGNNYGSPGGGAYQFLDSTWQGLGYTGTASDAPPALQDAAARQLQALYGWDQWTTAPLCGRV